MNQQSQVYKHNYEKWEGQRSAFSPAWMLIARHSFTNVVSSTGCFSRTILIFFFSIYYFLTILATVVRYQFEALKDVHFLMGLVAFAEEAIKGFNEVDFHKYWILWPGLIFSTFCLLMYGSPLISKDKAANALQVYFSKALHRRDYIFGKFMALGGMTASVTLVPAAMMLAMGLLFTPDHLQFIGDAWMTPFMALFYWALLTIGLGSFNLVFSAFFDKGYMAAIGYLGFLLFAAVVSSLMVVIMGSSPILESFNWFFSIIDIGFAIYGHHDGFTPALVAQIVSLSVICTACIYMISRKIRPVEVIS